MRVFDDAPCSIKPTQQGYNEDISNIMKSHLTLIKTIFRKLFTAGFLHVFCNVICLLVMFVFTWHLIIAVHLISSSTLFQKRHAWFGLWGDGRGVGAASSGEARLHHPDPASVQQQPVPTPGPSGHERLQESKEDTLLLFSCVKVGNTVNRAWVLSAGGVSVGAFSGSTKHKNMLLTVAFVWLYSHHTAVHHVSHRKDPDKMEKGAYLRSTVQWPCSISM